jgi:hypothetical protein
MRQFVIAALVALATAFAGLATPAAALERPTGKVVLVITGHIEKRNSERGAEFDIAMLEALESRTATMRTPWTEGETTFSGPLGRALMAEVGAEGSVLLVRALNDYVAEVPMDDFVKLDTMLASRLNGAAIPVREKGPLFVIYPFDKRADLYNEKYFSRSVWQVKSIDVR